MLSPRSSHKVYQHLGIRAPRPARTTADRGTIIEKAEPYGQEALDFAARKFMQRDVDVEFDSTDKTGGFIGTLYLNKTENAAIDLIRDGLANVHSYSADSLSWSKQLYDAEVNAYSISTLDHVLTFCQAEAKSAGRGVSLLTPE